MKNTAQDSPPIGIDDKVAALSQSSIYPSAPRGVEHIETHMAHVFLTDEHAWKLKKPVKTPFLDFSTIEKRRHDCKEEVRLNRRLAPEVYLGVVPLRRSTENRLQLNGDGETVDWLVQMRRLPRERSLESMIKSDCVGPEDIRPSAQRLGDFYHRAAPIAIAAGDYPASLLASIDANGRELNSSQFGFASDQLQPLQEWQRTYVEKHRGRLDQRVLQGHVIEAHGDLRPEHIFLVDPPMIVDCLEFNRELRILDTASELMFLALECERLGAAWVQQSLLETYAAVTKDAPLPDLLLFYRAWHACTRAKISLWHIHDGRDNADVWKAKAHEYLRLATPG